MTEQEMRIAIAEACGWKWKARAYQPTAKWLFPPDVMPRFDGSTHWLGNIVGEFEPCDPPKTISFNPFGSDCPDYPNDLNAMHEAEKVLDRNQKNRYLNILHEICMPDEHDDVDDDFNWCTARADQRAEAFVKTLNLWTE